MTRNLTTYILTLLSAFVVYWTFGTMMTVSVGPTNYGPVISFYASVVSFGVGSWLFMHFVKLGRSLGIMLGLVTIAWPAMALFSLITEPETFGFIFYGIPVTMMGVVIYAHLRNFNDPQKPPIVPRVILSILPFGLMVAYIIYLIRLGYFG